MPKCYFRAMNCEMLALVEGQADDQSVAPHALDRVLSAVPSWFEAWEQTLSRFRPESELRCLNTNTQGKIMPVSDTLCEVLAAALDAAVDTDGIVTPTVIDALEYAGYTNSFETIHLESASMPTMSIWADAPKMPQRWREIILNRVERCVCLPKGVRLDVGGVAKGWAADQAAQRLCAYGAALVDAGGDVAVRQCDDGTRRDHAAPHPFAIGIANPFDPTNDLELLRLTEGGVATSGRDYRRWQRNGQLMHHLIDPRTDTPAQTDILSATVIAPSTQQADIAAKVWLILGSANGTQWLESQPQLAGLAVLEDGTIVRSSQFNQYVWP